MKLILTGLLIVVNIALAGNYLFADETVRTAKGKEVILHDNFTWEYSNQDSSVSKEALILTKTAGLKNEFKSPSGNYSIFWDPSAWRQTKELNAQAEMNFTNKEGSGFAMVLFDGLFISLDQMKNIVIINAKKIDANAYLIETQPCVVNGTKGMLATYTAENQGLKFIFYSLIVAADKGTLQFTFFTLESAFADLKPKFQQAMAGLVY